VGPKGSMATPRRFLNMNRMTRWLVALLVASSGLFVWSVYKNVAIGVHASDTNTFGGTDLMAWVWLLVSIVGIAGSIVGIVLEQNRQKRGTSNS